uniref:Aminotransferase class V-fold PLP-dependent enzyme n=1 Tax=candidate division WOR-3 bacterium TaxID=2052148 RepID=A0A7C4GFJ4_UNCW3
MHTCSSFGHFRELVVGLDRPVPTLCGQPKPYVSLDNASSTPTLKPIMAKVDEFLGHYSNVHRGAGFKSQLASWAFDESRRIIARFVGADPTEDVVVFTRNTTEALNKLARLYPFEPDSVILTTLMEHHSNDLPWRRRGRTVPVGLTPDGALDMDDLRRKLDEYRGRVAMVAVSGASNVTGWVNPIHEIAQLAHAAGARIAVDAAQLVAHRPIDMKPADDPGHLDFVAFAGHKMYAPYGVGALVGSRRVLAQAEPDLVGGGVVHLVTTEAAIWNDLPAREEAGTPAVAGAVALAAAARLLEKTGWDAIREHEENLARRLLARLLKLPGIAIYGCADETRVGDRLSVFAFNLAGLRHSLVATILACEGGIAVRCGMFCAHPYMLSLLGIEPAAARRLGAEMAAGDYRNLPGAVRASIGIYNNEADIDALGDWLETISAGRHSGRYRLVPATGGYVPEQGERFENLGRYFSLDPL